MHIAIHVLTCFSEYQNILCLELNIDMDKAISIFISQVNTFYIHLNIHQYVLIITLMFVLQQKKLACG